MEEAVGHIRQQGNVPKYSCTFEKPQRFKTHTDIPEPTEIYYKIPRF
jgi:hypothetical protein